MTTAVESCPGCGLFLHHAEGCRGIVAVYWRYMQRHEENGFQTVDEAVTFLMSGEDAGTLSSEAVLGPDGSVIYDGDALGNRYVYGTFDHD